jgi:hypothetical protein
MAKVEGQTFVEDVCEQVPEDNTWIQERKMIWDCRKSHIGDFHP